MKLCGLVGRYLWVIEISRIAKDKSNTFCGSKIVDVEHKDSFRFKELGWIYHGRAFSYFYCFCVVVFL